MLDASVETSPEDLLVAVAQHRDRQAFAQLFTLFAPRVKGYLMRTAPDPGRADELTQEVMLRVWRKAGSYDRRRAAASTWIFTIARNARIDAFRRERRPTYDPDDPAFVPSSPVEPDKVAEAVQQQKVVRDALEELPEEQAAILYGAYFDDKTLRVISDEQAVPLGTVKSRVRLAMKRLRAVLGEAKS